MNKTIQILIAVALLVYGVAAFEVGYKGGYLDAKAGVTYDLT